MNLLASFRHNERWTSLGSHIILGVMMTVSAVGIIRFGSYIIPGWNTTGLTVVSLLISVEAILSIRIFNKLSEHNWNPFIYYLAEWVVLAILLKVFTEMRFGVSFFLANLNGVLKNFSDAFFSDDYILNLVLTIIIWLFTTLFARNLIDLEGDEILLRNDDISVNRRSIHREILSRFLKLGALLAIIAGIMKQSRFTLFNHAPASSADISFVFLYFLLGLVLLSLTNFASLRASWSLEHVKIQHNLAARWILYSFLFLTGLTGLALILPAHYSVGLITIFAYLLNLLLYGAQLVLRVILVIFTFISSILLYLIRLIFGRPGTIFGEINPQLIPKMVPYAPAQSNAPSWWEIIKSLFFWLFLITVVIYSFYQFLQRNQELTQMLGQFRFGRWLVRVWDWLQGFLKHTGQNVRAAVQAGIRQLRARRASQGTGGVRSFLRLNRLTARQRVLYYYQMLVRRAGETGLPRRPWMTPRDYSEVLYRELSGQMENINSITDAFVEARYSQHEVPESVARRVKSAWALLHDNLRKRRRKKK